MYGRFWISDETVLKFAELRIGLHCQRQKRITGIVVSSKVRFIRIFAGFAGEKASNESAVVENGDFR